MSFDHKAFAFDWQAFQSEMLPWFKQALEADDCKKFQAFVARNLDDCRNPYEGEPLEEDWEETVDVTDVQQLADYALTKFYEPSDSHGLSDAWMELDESLAPEIKHALLGRAIEGFDPGRQGAYFLSPAEAKQSADLLQSVADREIREYARFLAQTAGEGRGVYVTF